jgi:hypothetical protein
LYVSDPALIATSQAAPLIKQKPAHPVREQAQSYAQADGVSTRDREWMFGLTGLLV